MVTARFDDETRERRVSRLPPCSALSSTVQGIRLYSIAHLACASVAGDNTMQRQMDFKEQSQHQVISPVYYPANF